MRDASGFTTILGIAALALATAIIWPIQALQAQATATTAQGITGSVTDLTGAAVAGAQVVAQSIATSVEFKTTTGESGYFSFPGLPCLRKRPEHSVLRLQRQ